MVEDAKSQSATESATEEERSHASETGTAAAGETVAGGQAETLAFDADVSRLLEIVTHSLYSNRDIFLRELIANAADACEKRRYLALSDPALLPDEGFAVTLQPDAAGARLVVADNGVGMNRQELVENLGTIAASGTGRFLRQLKESGGDAKGALSQIGQFGVGFYSAFMVADEVEVISRKARPTRPAGPGARTASGSYTIAAASQARPAPGTRVILTLKQEPRVPRDRPPAPDHRDLLRPHRLADPHRRRLGREGGRGRRRAGQPRLGALDPAEVARSPGEQYTEFYRHVGQRLRRALADAAHPRPIEGHRIHRPALRAVRATRSTSSTPTASRACGST